MNRIFEKAKETRQEGRPFLAAFFVVCLVDLSFSLFLLVGIVEMQYHIFEIVI
ncbi:hypothetical protein J2S09_000603 [Bacillus fengqiuensis]|nr:hypothetical protein [Bacillus fengqiuensis]